MTSSYHEESVTSSHNLKNALKLIGRILLSAVFIFIGLNQGLNWTGAINYSNTSIELPIPDYLMVTSVIFQVLGALSLLIGYKVRIGGILLLIYIIPATILYYHFWDLDDISQLTQIQLFLKNVSIMGGLFYLIAEGAGDWSLDGRLKKRRM